MLIKKILLLIIKILMIQITSDENDLEKYQKLKIEDTSSIKTTDLPFEFSKEAFEIVDEFIKKTKNIDFEILIYFDYIEGKILKCKLGSETNVKLKFDENEFKGKHVASIHNHTKDMYTPPSDKNFGIFSREWEDFELIAGINKLWILKSKLKDEKLTFELKTSSSILFRIALESASLKYQNQDEIDDECDELYGKLLSNYINDKNINNIQLKQRDILMTENIEYACRKKIRDPKVIEKIRKQAKDTTIIHGQEALEALYSQMGMKLNIDEIPSL